MARVLVIDDDEESRTLLRAMLEGVGHVVQEAMNGQEGVDIFQGKPTDLVITDINMPGMDGHEVIVALRKLQDGIPILAISGGGSMSKEDLLLKAASLGASEVIVKPFEFQQLVGAVQRALIRWAD